MLHFNKIDLYFEPRNAILPLLPKIEGEPEMSHFDSAFLCGVIRKFAPEKIVEVGIACGGTTAIILQCIHMLGLDNCNVYSIDYSEKFYRDNTISSGYLGKLALELLPELKNRHKFLLGNTACTWNDRLKDCDCLIIDTIHLLPGEVLEFITLLPILKNGAVIVLHDIHLNQTKNKNAIATGAIFSAAVGEKYMNWDDSSFECYPNIGAVVVNEDTRKNIYNIFLALLLTWSYLPDNKQIAEYRRVIENLYDEESLHIFDVALKLNKRTHARLKKELIRESATYLFPFNKIEAGSRIVLFGAGEVGQSYKYQVDRLKYCNIVKWIDSSWTSIDIEEVASPDTISDVEYDYVVIATIKEKYVYEIKSSLLNAEVPTQKIVHMCK